MSPADEFIEKHHGDVYAAAADMLQRLMVDGPNFKLGYTAGNAYAAVMDQFRGAGHSLDPMLLVDKAFPKREKPQVFISQDTGYVVSTTIVRGREDVDVIFIDWSEITPDHGDYNSIQLDTLAEAIDDSLRLPAGYRDSNLRDIRRFLAEDLPAMVDEDDEEGKAMLELAAELIEKIDKEKKPRG